MLFISQQLASIIIIIIHSSYVIVVPNNSCNVCCKWTLCTKTGRRIYDLA